MAFGTARIYLDWASAAPVSTAAKKAFMEALPADGNPSAPHAEGRAAREILEEARTTIARLAEAKTDSVIFTSGATEANNLAIQGRIMALRSAGAKHLHILYLPTAHASVVETLKAYNVELEAIKLVDGAIDLQALRNQVCPETVMVAMDAVCGETGTRFDTRDVRRAIDAKWKGITLHVDASQLPLIESFELTRLGADSLTLDAQKVGGVRGIGALIIRHGHKLTLIMHGGGQEQGMRPGTEMPALAASFAAALVEAKANRELFVARTSETRAALIDMLQTAIPDSVVNEGKEFASHILNLSFPGRDTDYAAALLDEAGFAVSTKSACETDVEGSRVVLALTNDAERAASTLRISFGSEISKKNMKKFATELIRTIRFLDTHRL